MAKSAKASKGTRLLASFQAALKVEVLAPRFEPLSSLRSLDFERLGRGRHEVELGFVHGGCCRKLVRAIVKDGKVTGCAVEPCAERAEKASPELLALAAQARRKIGANRRWKPVALKTLVRSNELMSSLVIVGGGCVFICCFGHCIMCCWWPRPHCFFPDIYTGPLS